MPNLLYVTLILPLLCCLSNALACSSIGNIEVPGAEVLSITGITRTNVSLAASTINPAISGLNICDITIILTHPGANDTVTVEVWLPTSGWNGRFQATGGGGFSVGYGPPGLAPAAAEGYSAASSDGGNFGAGFSILPDALVDGHVNWPLLLNYASRSVHDMTVAGKAVTHQYYGKDADYSYFSGCSNGGREGYVSAMMYPDDFDGILAISPVVNEPEVGMAIQWPYVVMQNEKRAPSQCMFQAFVNASIALCDRLDGVEDGIIGNLHDCHFDPFTLVGQRVTCDGKTSIIDHETAYVVGKIYNGPIAPNGVKLWNGLDTGTGFNGNFGGMIEVTTTNGTTVATPESLSQNYIQYLLKQNPTYDTSNMSYAEYTSLFLQGAAEYDSIVGSNNPDLSAFHKSGAKLLSWHGLADNLAPSGSTLNYRQRVNALLGGTEAVDNFYRLFFAPGVNHCGAGYGPVPVSAFEQLVAWVENGTAPDVLPAQFVNVHGDMVSHDICRYPLVSKYIGGDAKVAGSYVCADSFL